jgi:hypothetical protein
MNKNLLKICFVIALTACAASAYGTTIISIPVQLGGGSYSPSNKVKIAVDTSSTAYTAKSKHASGDRVIATNNSDPKMWYKTVAVANDVETATITDVLSSAAWTSM